MALTIALLPYTLASPLAGTVMASLAPNASTIAISSSSMTEAPSSIATVAPDSTLEEPSDPTGPDFYVRNFRAFVPDASEPKLNAWVMFHVADGEHGPSEKFETTCSVMFNGSMHDDGGYRYHPCERQMGHLNDRVGFRISEGFNEVVLKRQWTYGE